MGPLVTVGIPTYNRPDLLARALEAVSKQSYREIAVLVADNGPSSLSEAVVESYRAAIPNLRYYSHDQNIGQLRNFLFLLSNAESPYFMWLADDDEVSPHYVRVLVELLESKPAASSAAGHWMLMKDEVRGRVMPTSNYPQRSALVRALRFIWRSDDAFFYGLHRTNILREASFPGYNWPNRGVLWNWAYVYLLDVVLRGTVLLSPDPSAQFINHDYTQKTETVPPRSMRAVGSRVARRVNVHFLYWGKCARYFGPWVIPLVIVISALSLAREGTRKVLLTGRRQA